MGYSIHLKKIISEGKVLSETYLHIEGEYIVGIDNDGSRFSDVITLAQYTAVPGFIDFHIHGGNGYDVMDGTCESLNALSQYAAKQGVTAFLATTVTSTIERLEQVLDTVQQGICNGTQGAEILGTYLEGPYLSAERKGAHPESFLKKPSLEELSRLIKASKGTLKVVALAPELEGAEEAIRFLKDQGIKVALGHTDSDYETAMQGYDAGASIGVHLFNGMKPLHHRDPGIVGATLNHPQVYAELIADGIHVHPGCLKLVEKAIGAERICLITDCMRAGGLGDGRYRLGELDVIVADGVARVETGSLAGSTLTLKNALKNMMMATDLSLEKAVQMITKVPADILELQEYGHLSPLAKANITIIDDGLNIIMTIVKGHVVYNQIVN